MYNKLILIGRLGKDPENRGTDGVIASMNIATVNFYKKKTGEGVEEVEWTQCLAFGKLGELVMSQAKKGDLVVVEGKKKTNTYEKDGVSRSNIYMLVDNFKRLSWNREAQPGDENDLTEDKQKEAVIN